MTQTCVFIKACLGFGSFVFLLQTDICSHLCLWDALSGYIFYRLTGETLIIRLKRAITYALFWRSNPVAPSVWWSCWSRPAYCFLSAVSSCVTFIPASPRRNSRNRRWPPWLKSSAACSSRDKVCHFLQVIALGKWAADKQWTARLCGEQCSQMLTVPNTRQLIPGPGWNPMGH